MTVTFESLRGLPINPDDVRPEYATMEKPVPKTIDLATLRVGDTVHLRDGTVSVVTNVEPRVESVYPFRVTLDGVDALYTRRGTYHASVDSLLDIVAIVPLVVEFDPRLGSPTPDSGTKNDDGKTELGLLPFAPIEEVAKVLGYGAKKYQKYNYKGGFEYTRLIGAALRHLFAFARGQDKDPETGLSHVAHAVCNLLFLLDQQIAGTGTDDRFKETLT